MNWFRENYKWLFDGVAGAIAVTITGWLVSRLKSDKPIGTSPVAHGAGNIQAPIEIHTARDVHIGHALGAAPTASPSPKRTAVTASPNLQYAGWRTKQVFVSPSSREGISDPSLDEQDGALEALVLKFENRVLSDRRIARAMNVIAKIRFRAPDGVRARSIDYGVWLNSPCNSTDIGVGDTCELVLLGVIEERLLAFDDRRSDNRYFDSDFSYFEPVDVDELEEVEITIIDQNSQFSLNHKLRVRRQGSSFRVE